MRVLVWVVALLLTVAPAGAARFALVVGNQDYVELRSLNKAIADAQSFGAVLEEKGFEVILGLNLTRLGLDESIARFIGAVQPGDTAVFVYAGHGWSDGKENFLIGTDTPRSASPELLARVSIPVQNGVNGIIDQLQARGAFLNVVILDACRDNPFSNGGTRSGGLSRGLTRIDPPQGTFVIFSAGAGQAALDRLDVSDPDPNGVFTRVFLPLVRADMPLLDAIKETQERVYELSLTTDFIQEPAYYDQVRGRPCLTGACDGLPQPVDGPLRPTPSNDLKVANLPDVTIPQRVPPAVGLGGPSAFSWRSLQDFANAHSGLGGQQLTIWGPWRPGGDQEAFEAVLTYFEDATGIDVEYGSSDNYEQQALIDAAAGSSANITIMPNPGPLADLASQGHLAPLGDQMVDFVRTNHVAGDSLVSLGTFGDPQGRSQFYAVPYRVYVKSLVWYAPENFAKAGYEVPKTFEELQALTGRMIEDGNTPWCIGLGSGGATGWPGTDWVEDYVLRTLTPEDYDAWVRNDLRFDDPKIIAALEFFRSLAADPAMVAGGSADADFRDSANGLFSLPPQCFMHRQASFIPAFFPEGTQVGRDADFFYFPAFAGKRLGTPVIVSGTLASITRDSPAARAFIDFLGTPISNEIWMAQSGFLSTLKAANVGTYGNDILKRQAEILLSATTVRFDASDLMPGQIGAGSFWAGMVDLAAGKAAQDVASDIQRSWESIR